MEAEALRWWSLGSYTCSCDVPTLASDFEDRGMVFEYGITGIDWVILRDGDLQADIVLCHRLHGASGIMALPELV